MSGFLPKILKARNAGKNLSKIGALIRAELSQIDLQDLNVSRC
jgi:hypothetical protein